MHPMLGRQETPLNSAEDDPLGIAGDDSIVHADPSQSYASGVAVPDAPVKVPTAMQESAVAHDTALSALDVEPAGVGRVSSCHDFPFHCSLKAFVALEESR